MILAPEIGSDCSEIDPKLFRYVWQEKAVTYRGRHLKVLAGAWNIKNNGNTIQEIQSTHLV